MLICSFPPLTYNKTPGYIRRLWYRKNKAWKYLNHYKGELKYCTPLRYKSKNRTINYQRFGFKGSTEMGLFDKASHKPYPKIYIKGKAYSDEPNLSSYMKYGYYNNGTPPFGPAHIGGSLLITSDYNSYFDELELNQD